VCCGRSARCQRRRGCKVWDKTTSYKFVGGKLVARTAEEHARLVEMRKPASPIKPNRAARSKDSFIMISQAQQERLNTLGLSPCMRLFMALLWEDFRHRGRAFPLPAGKVLDPQAQRRALSRLEAGGLISVQRRPPKPPLITILLSSRSPETTRSLSD
jgi:hypothetical protein